MKLSSIVQIWYVWLSIIIVLLVQKPEFFFFLKSTIPSSILSLVSEYYLLFSVVGFLGYWALFNYLVPLVLKNSRWKDFLADKQYPKRYFDALRFSNNVIVAIVGITLGMFKLSGMVISVHESRMLTLLILSILFGLIAVITQITPRIKPCSKGYVSAPQLTRHMVYSATFLQVMFVVTGYFEAYVVFVSGV